MGSHLWRLASAFFAALVAATVGAAPITPFDSDRFVDSIGVNIQLGGNSPGYTNHAQVKANLLSVGVRHVRNPLWGHPPPYATFNDYASAGIRLIVPTGYNHDGQGADALVSQLRSISSAVEGVEGVNEPDNFARTVTQRGYGWDTHDRGGETLRNHLLPKLNDGLGTLLTDLHERGLLGETLVVAMGEFGRTPRVKRDGGRDHWPQCYSLLLAGGGVHGGLVHGRSDRDGARPAMDPVEAREILMTILTLVGVPTFVTDPQGRAAPLFEGVEPVRRLYG